MGTTGLAQEEGLASTGLPRSPASGRMAREFLHSVAESTDGRLDVIVTELVTNAIVHGCSQPQLTVEARGDLWTITVADDGPGEPVVRTAEAVATSGRGLAIVAQMADDWGVRPRADGPGKLVWARLRVVTGG